MSDRRQHPRLSIAVEVDLRSEHNFYSAQTRDLSVGGLFIETDVALPIGTRLARGLAQHHMHPLITGGILRILPGDNLRLLVKAAPRN